MNTDMIECPECRGEGVLDIIDECGWCDGLGYDPDDGEECDECHGSGEYAAECLMCDGFGEIEAEEKRTRRTDPEVNDAAPDDSVSAPKGGAA